MKRLKVLIVMICVFVGGGIVEANSGLYRHFTHGELSEIDVWVNGYTVLVDDVVRAYPDYGYTFDEDSYTEATLFYEGNIYLPIEKMSEFIYFEYEVEQDVLNIYPRYEYIDSYLSLSEIEDDLNSIPVFEFEVAHKEDDNSFFEGRYINNEFNDYEALLLKTEFGDTIIIVDSGRNGIVDYSYTGYDQYSTGNDIGYFKEFYGRVIELYENQKDSIEYVDDTRHYIITAKR